MGNWKIDHLSCLVMTILHTAYNIEPKQIKEICCCDLINYLFAWRIDCYPQVNLTLTIPNGHYSWYYRK